MQGAGVRGQDSGKLKTLTPTPLPRERGFREKKTTPFPAVRVVPPWSRGRGSGVGMQGSGKRAGTGGPAED